jgi:hypothetical protein
MSILGHVPNDGYTETAYIAEVPRLYPEVRITFRPLPNEKRTLISYQIDKKKDTDRPGHWNAVIAKQVLSWSLKDEKGDPLPTTDKLISRLKPALYTRIFGLIMGSDNGDEDPNGSKKNSGSELSLDELLAGKDADSQEVADQKN